MFGRPAVLLIMSILTWVNGLAALVLSSNETFSVTSNCASACAELSQQFPNAYRPDANFGISLWDQKQQQVQPACRVQPANAQEVAGALTIVRENACNFAVKSGGHAQNADDSNSVGGVTIDLTAIRTIEPLGNGTRVRLGTGHNLSSAYEGLEARGISTVLGHSAGVGLGGYILGGGMSTLTHQYGFGMDQTFQYELVLPNSTILNVTHQSQPDLFWALRGGGPGANFGIVTHVTMLAVPSQPVLGGVMWYDDEQTDAVLDEIYNLSTGPASNDTAGSIYTRFGYEPDSDTFATALTENYIGATNTSPAIFARLNAIPSFNNTLHVSTERELALAEAAGTPNGMRNVFATITYHASADLDRELYAILREESRSIRNVSGLVSNIVSQPMYRQMFPLMKARGGNAVGLDGYEGPLTLVLYTITWSDAKDDDRVNAMVDRLVNRGAQAADAHNASVPWLYSNYGKANQDVFASYGKENHERLKRIQKSVDPNGVFASWGLCQGSHKLW